MKKMALPARLQTTTEEIPRATTGLRGKCYIHVDYLGGRIVGIRLSEKGKDGSTLDDLFTALGDALTNVIREVQR
jgi:hypothetical protein